MHAADDLPGSQERADLEDLLLPLVRRALRRKNGPPALVVWVQRSLAALPETSPHDPDGAARKLTRLLCDFLLRQTKTDNPRVAETVCGF
jgi:hypothetical protein